MKASSVSLLSYTNFRVYYSRLMKTSIRRRRGVAARSLVNVDVSIGFQLLSPPRVSPTYLNQFNSSTVEVKASTITEHFLYSPGYACELRKKNVDCCYWHRRWNAMRMKAFENAGRQDGRQDRRQSANNRLRTRYISPYHENPVDFEKYDREMNKLNADRACCHEGRDDDCDKCAVSKAKQRKTVKPPPRPLATGCAADFQIFGKSPSQTTAASE
ncbi:hypothetical protein NUW58_g2061 [Xylaria curta]|uniref:Uncharacterized protein n=1 Tax=Xylaria curta TaxID=42375 RepID=A0ACC1PHJ3_9PEZI|nr:hypothetical protein NUW58_g2061 [Xylaria curta]